MLIKLLFIVHSTNIFCPDSVSESGSWGNLMRVFWPVKQKFWAFIQHWDLMDISGGKHFERLEKFVKVEFFNYSELSPRRFSIVERRFRACSFWGEVLLQVVSCWFSKFLVNSGTVYQLKLVTKDIPVISQPHIQFWCGFLCWGAVHNVFILV